MITTVVNAETLIETRQVTNATYHEGRLHTKITDVSTNSHIITYGRSINGKKWDACNEQIVADAFRWIHNQHQDALDKLGIAWFDIDVIHSVKALKEWAKLNNYDRPHNMCARVDYCSTGVTIAVNAMAWPMDLRRLLFHEFCHILVRIGSFRDALANEYPNDKTLLEQLIQIGYDEDSYYEEIMCDAWAMDMVVRYRTESNAM